MLMTRVTRKVRGCPIQVIDFGAPSEQQCLLSCVAAQRYCIKIDAGITKEGAIDSIDLVIINDGKDKRNFTKVL